jgi:hypothetical protein
LLRSHDFGAKPSNTTLSDAGSRFKSLPLRVAESFGFYWNRVRGLVHLSRSMSGDRRGVHRKCVSPLITQPEFTTGRGMLLRNGTGETYALGFST